MSVGEALSNVIEHAIRPVGKLELAFDKWNPTGYTTAKFSFAAKENT
jgi:hypothetical protein